jgi:poly-beta-hydroxyalkanoate depolymerase
VATAPPTNQLDDSILFTQQVDALIKQHLSEEGKYLFSHFTQAHGFLLMAITIARHHGSDKAHFKRFVEFAWEEAEAHFSIVEEEKV